MNHLDQSLPVKTNDQVPLRMSAIKPFLDRIEILDAVVARGGPLKPVSGGVYQVNKKIISTYKKETFSSHASNCGGIMAAILAKKWNCPAFIVDPVTTDEFIEEARFTGVPGLKRKSRSHALNIKYCVQKTIISKKIDPDSSRFVVAHLGSGFSIAAVKKGEIIYVNDALLGMGPFSIERAGSLPLAGIISLVYDKGYTKKTLKELFSYNSGLKGYLGTNDLKNVEERIRKGEEKAESVYNAMVYQIQKEIGSMYAVLNGNVHGLILTGGLCHSSKLVVQITSGLPFFDDIIIYPGSFENEALANGAMNALYKKVPIKQYQ